MKLVKDRFEDDYFIGDLQPHDGLVQDIVGAKMILDAHLSRDNLAEKEHLELERAAQYLKKTVDECRRLIADLRPMIIDEEGVVASVEYLINEMLADIEIDVCFEHDVTFNRLPPLLENNIYRIVQEALTNIKRHSKASAVTLRIKQDNQSLVIEVEDNGIGFDVTRTFENRFGVVSMRERARLFQGKTRIDSDPKLGTRVRVELPLGESESSL